jgi:hypothetical protein
MRRPEKGVAEAHRWTSKEHKHSRIASPRPRGRSSARPLRMGLTPVLRATLHVRTTAQTPSHPSSTQQPEGGGSPSCSGQTRVHEAPAVLTEGAPF